MARQQRQLHMQLYPNWTMRDSVASGAARKRRNKRDKAADGGRNSKQKQKQTSKQAIRRAKQTKQTITKTVENNIKQHHIKHTPLELLVGFVTISEARLGG